jgi:hypothetical protein
MDAALGFSPMAKNSWITIEDYKSPGGWTSGEQRDERSRSYCEMLERGEILFFRETPFSFPTDDQKFLLSQQWSELRMHKNVSYRPAEGVLRGVSGDAATTQRLQKIFKDYTAQVIQFAGNFLRPYKDKWNLDFASFRPLEEEGRDLPLHKRNDLLHVDAFPSRPTRGGRIMRIFTNLNPTRARVWNTTDSFETIAKKYAKTAGLEKIADADSSIGRVVQSLGAKLGLTAPGRTPYDMFMLRFHDYLKENTEFQKNTPKTEIDFPPLATWIVFTDCVAHAVMSGQYAIEQTFLIPPNALVNPQAAPYKILEEIAGRPLIG